MKNSIYVLRGLSAELESGMPAIAARLTCHNPQKMVGASYIHNMLSLSG